MCVVKGDGASGANCAALNFHSDEKLGIYVRRNINQHLADFFRFYENGIIFPQVQTAGKEILPFKNKEEYLDFLQNDSRSAYLWMEHYDLQALSNIYQVSVHILTTDVKGKKETKARWTHLSPDERLKDFGTEIGEVPDLWLMHIDENHFDLIVPRNSIIIQGSNQVKPINIEKSKKESDKEKECSKETENKLVTEKDKDEGPGYMGWTIDDANENVNFSTKLEDLKMYFTQMKANFNKLKEDFDNINDKLKKKEEKEGKIAKKLNIEISKLKEDYKECLKHLQKETFERNKAETSAQILRETLEVQNVLKKTSNPIIEVEEMEVVDEKEESDECAKIAEEQNKTDEHRKKHDNTNQCSQCTNIFNSIQDLREHEQIHRKGKIYKCEECKEIFLNEEVMEKHQVTSHSTRHLCQKCCKTFMSESELKEHTDEHKNVDVYECQHCRETFRSAEELKQHQKVHSEGIFVTCDLCEQSFSTDTLLKEHKDEHKNINVYGCQNCRESFRSEDDLRHHQKVHRGGICVSCDQCDRSFSTDVLMKEHKESVHDQQFNCQKCDKFYSSMKKLRRHDWRSHREVSCNICEEKIDSREEISNHRRSKHNMFRKILCKFYPACLDGDECFFSHDESDTDNIKSDMSNNFCPRGESCTDQSCSFSESNHRKLNNILCRYQANCSRRACGYLHSVKRRAFLDEGSQTRGIV